MPTQTITTKDLNVFLSKWGVIPTPRLPLARKQVMTLRWPDGAVVTLKVTKGGSYAGPLYIIDGDWQDTEASGWKIMPKLRPGAPTVQIDGGGPSHAQAERQNHRANNGQYAEVFPCYRCGKSAGEDYASFNGDTQDALGNEWHDTALCLCDKCAKHMQTLTPAWAWAEANSPAWGQMPQGKPAKFLFKSLDKISAEIMGFLCRPVIDALCAGKTDEAKAHLDAIAIRVEDIKDFEVFHLGQHLRQLSEKAK